MANYKVVNAEQLDSDLTSIADAIREKGGMSERLVFPADFVSAIKGFSGLNYEVVGGTTEPTDPKKNTIWANTDTEITSHVFSATEPENPVEGMLWISVGISSGFYFSATKENPIMVYPISAKQYVSEMWVVVICKSYQGGTWEDWFSGLIYEYGHYYVKDSSVAKTPEAAAVTDYDTYIQMNTPANSESEAYKVFGPFSFAGFTTLTVSGKVITGGNLYLCAFVSPYNDVFRDAAVAKVEKNIANTFSGTVTLDLSTLEDGVYYIYAGWNTYGALWSGARTAQLLSVKLE